MGTWTTEKVTGVSHWVNHTYQGLDPQEASRQRLRDGDRVTTLRLLSKSPMISRRRTYVFSYSFCTLGRHIQWLQIASTKVVAVGVEVCGVCVVWWNRAEAARGRQEKQQPATHGHVACAALPFLDLTRAMSSATGQQPQTGPTCAQQSKVANFIKKCSSHPNAT